MNKQSTFHYQPGFPAGYCPPGSAIDNCQPARENTTDNLTMSFVYTIATFLAVCLASYLFS